MEKDNLLEMKKIKTRVEKVFGEHSRVAEVFWNCYQNTLETTLKYLPDGTAYVITGDIPAMWLRDSAAQMRPYLFQAKEDKEMQDLIAGLVRRQFFYINQDCYANAFNEKPNGAHWALDRTQENPWVWERKFEIDSLCYPVQLAWLLWKTTGCVAQFDDNFMSGIGKILEVFETEQHHETASPYYFERKDSYFQDTLSRDGKGALVKPDTGLIWSGFRPSDDACVYGYLIPSNMFAVVILGYLKELAGAVFQNPSLEQRAEALKEQVRSAIEEYGITEREGYGRIYAYEVDGYGQYHLMDDANVPSLLSMRYLGYEPEDPKVAENTRKFILSEGNPYYFSGKKASGIGSMHTLPGYIWHIALAMEGLTEPAMERKKEILAQMIATDGGTKMMHEGFFAEDDKQFTRPWFSWANAMFCELVLDCCGCRVLADGIQRS